MSVLFPKKKIELETLKECFKQIRTSKLFKKHFFEFSPSLEEPFFMIHDIPFSVDHVKSLCQFYKSFWCLSLSQNIFWCSNFYCKMREKHHFLYPSQLISVSQNYSKKLISSVFLDDKIFQFFFISNKQINAKNIDKQAIYIASSIDMDFDFQKYTKIKYHFPERDCKIVVCSSNTFSIYNLTIF